MSRVCQVCGKGPVAGRQITRRGMAKKKGGSGRRTTGVTARRFLPNIQNVNALVDGRKMKMKVCTKCIKAGKVQRAA